jgi:hypothetical protein
MTHNPTRRTALLGALALAAPLAADIRSDPIYAAIERHRGAAATFASAPSEASAAAAYAAADTLARTESSTMAGMMHVLDYAADLDGDDLPGDFADNLLASLRVALARQFGWRA